MSRLAIARRALASYRYTFVGIGLVAFFMALVDVAIYPSYRDMLADMELPDAFKGFYGEAGGFASPEGFMNTEFFSWIPLLLIIVAVVAGTGVIAGEEGAGTMDLLLAQPVRRRRVLLQKVSGVALGLAGAAILSLPGFFIAMAWTEIEITHARLVAATLNMLPITFVYLALAALAAAVLPSRSAAALATTALVVAAYVLQLVASAVTFLEGWQKLSPFYWSDGSHVLLHGFDFLRAGGLLAIAAAFLVVAVVAFERRDVAAAGRQWRLWRIRSHEAAAGPESPGRHPAGKAV